MIVTTHHIAGIDIFTADFHHLDGATLTEAQLSDISTIKAEKRRRERAMTYALVNHAAATRERYAALHGALLGHRDNGAPFLYSAEGEVTASISISHCKTGACIALGIAGEDCGGSSVQEFGVDIEDATDRLSRLADKYLTDREKAFIAGHDLLRAWTIKEAAYKAAAIEGLTLRDGIAIQSLDAANEGPAAAGAVTAKVAIAGKLYTAFSLQSAERCLTLCVGDVQPL